MDFYQTESQHLSLGVPPSTHSHIPLSGASYPADQSSQTDLNLLYMQDQSTQTYWPAYYEVIHCPSSTDLNKETQTTGYQWDEDAPDLTTDEIASMREYDRTHHWDSDGNCFSHYTGSSPDWC